MLKSIGPMELVIILVIAMLLFGGKKIPELAKGLGEGIRNFKKGLDGADNPEEAKNPAQLPTGQKDATRPGESSVSSDRRAT